VFVTLLRRIGQERGYAGRNYASFGVGGPEWELFEAETIEIGRDHDKRKRSSQRKILRSLDDLVELVSQSVHLPGM